MYLIFINFSYILVLHYSVQRQVNPPIESDHVLLECIVNVL